MEGFPVRSGVNAINCPVCEQLVKARMLKAAYPLLLAVCPKMVARLKMGSTEQATCECTRGHMATVKIRY